MAEVCKRTSLLVISPWIMVHLPRHMSPANPVPARVPPLLRDSAIGPPPCRNAAVGVSRSDNGGRRSECAWVGTIRETESDPRGGEREIRHDGRLAKHVAGRGGEGLHLEAIAVRVAA